MAFDNLLNKVKAGTKQAADTMGKAAKVTKLKMDLMTLSGERNRHLATIGSVVHSLYIEKHSLDSNELIGRLRSEFDQIERIDARVKEIETEIAELHALTATVTEVKEVKPDEKKS